MSKGLVSIALFAAMVSLLVAGCTSDQNAVNPAVRAAEEVDQPVTTYDFITCDSGERVQVISPTFLEYGAGTEDDYMRVLANGEVRETVDKFNDLGYALDPGNSFIIEGIVVMEGRTDSIDVKVVNVIMRYLPEITQSFVWIGYISSPSRPDLPNLVQTSVWSFVPPETDYWAYESIHLGTDENGVERNVWIKDYISPFAGKGDGYLAAWSWKKWLKCSVKTALGGCVGAAIGCISSGPAYGGCLGTWCGGAAVGGMLYCAADQLL